MKQLQIIGVAGGASLIAYALWQHGTVSVWTFLLVALLGGIVVTRVAVASNIITPVRVALALTGCTTVSWWWGSWWQFPGLAAAALFAWLQWWFKDPHTVLKKVLHWAIFASKSERDTRRWFRKDNRKQGVAGSIDVFRRASTLRVKRKAKHVRPSLAAMRFRQRLMVPVTACAVRLARVGRQAVYATHEDFVLVIGGPRSGKTGLTCDWAIGLPGAALIASTRVEIIPLTASYRREPWQPPKRWWHRWLPPTPISGDQERPVDIFNPGGDGGLQMQSTITFDPLDGCEDPVVALQRGMDMVLPLRSHDSHANSWVDRGGEAMGLLLHAAALNANAPGKHRTDMYSVLKWAANIPAHADTLNRILARSPEPAMQTGAEAFAGLNKDTQTSVTSGLLRALRWMNHPAAKRSAGVGIPRHLRAPALNMVEFAARCGTVYLIGEEDKITAPLVSALTAHVGRWAKSAAQSLPGRRHDPAIAMVLDEVANGFPMPLDKWSSWFGGNGIWMCAVLQSLSQLNTTWDRDAAKAIVDNAWAMMYLGGNKVTSNLEEFSKLAGLRLEATTTTRDGKVVSESTRPVEVITVAQLTRLPEGKTIMFITGLPPAIGRTRMAWKRRDFTQRTENAAEWTAAVARPDMPRLTAVPDATERDKQVA